MIKNIEHSTNTERAWIEIDKSKLIHNLGVINALSPESCDMMAVVKANAYGHGDIEISKELQKHGVRTFAVATVKEAIKLREEGIDGDILILGYTHPAEASILVQYHLIQTIVDYEYAIELNAQNKSVRTHVKIDTGMNRLGEKYTQIDNIVKILNLPNLTIEGLFTHLCVADSLCKEDVDFTRSQIEKFYKVVDELKALGYDLPKLHIQSSYGLLNYPTLSCDYVRIGIALYGLYSGLNETVNTNVDLKPILSLKARVAVVKDIEASESVGYGRSFIATKPMKIAIVTIGYADGLPRSLADGQVLVLGKKVPIIGRICMDQLTIDVTDVPDIKQSDIVTVIGSEGTESIQAEEVASQSGTITNELVSCLGSRLFRVYA